MKNNNKNRKLNFIRAKNNLRLGITKFCYGGKITNTLLKNTIASSEVIEVYINFAKSQCYKIWKLKLPFKDIEFGYTDDDFIRDLKTYRITLMK